MKCALLAGLALLAMGCAPSTRIEPGGNGDKPETDDPCFDGAERCEDGAAKVCENGRFVVAEHCENACVDGLGCVMCVPGSGSCSGEDATVCVADGSHYESFKCDPLQGLTCDFDSGRCDGPCSPFRLGESYIGCDYYPTVTANEVRSEFDYAVVISNASDDVAQIHIEGGALASARTFEVAPRAVRVERLPWVNALKSCEKYGAVECGNPTSHGGIVRDGAYHLRSTRPVTVYQYSPLEYQLAEGACTVDKLDGCSYTNDASLLLPVTSLTGHYFVAAWQNWPSRSADDWSGLVAITATQDATTVTIDSPAPTWGADGLPPLERFIPKSIVLDAGDVAQLFSKRDWQEQVDLTGASVVANKPVQVISGHYCTQTVGVACDHLEESMLPVEALGTEYIVTAPQAEEHIAFPNLTAFYVGQRYLRIIATEPDTNIEWDPPNTQAAGIVLPTHIENAGEFKEVDFVWFRDSMRIKADKKILVSEYMIGGQYSNIGDPAMAVAIPVEQYRTNYSFHAPLTYEKNYVNVVAPLDATVHLDGNVTPLIGFEPIGGTGYGLLRVLLDSSGDGTHTLQGSKPFGISVYGYGQYTSYWYPGGLDLKPITVN